MYPRAETPNMTCPAHMGMSGGAGRGSRHLRCTPRVWLYDCQINFFPFLPTRLHQPPNLWRCCSILQQSPLWKTATTNCGGLQYQDSPSRGLLLRTIAPHTLCFQQRKALTNESFQRGPGGVPGTNLHNGQGQTILAFPSKREDCVELTPCKTLASIKQELHVQCPTTWSGTIAMSCHHPDYAGLRVVDLSVTGDLAIKSYLLMSFLLWSICLLCFSNSAREGTALCSPGNSREHEMPSQGTKQEILTASPWVLPAHQTLANFQQSWLTTTQNSLFFIYLIHTSHPCYTFLH